MTKQRVALIAVPAVVLAVFLTAAWMTRGAMAHLGYLRAGGGGGATGEAATVDQRPWLTAAALAPLAVSAEERALAREAERLADHEVDQAFAMALRQASLDSRALTGPALALQQKLNGRKELVREDQARVDLLTGHAGDAAKNGGSMPSSLSDDLEEAKAQLQLDTDELNDGTDDLARESGDRRERIQQEFTAREAAMKKFDAQLSGGEMAVLAARRFGTLAARVNGWLDQRSRAASIGQAKRQADESVTELTGEHTALERETAAMSAQVKSAAAGGPGVREALPPGSVGGPADAGTAGTSLAGPGPASLLPVSPAPGAGQRGRVAQLGKMHTMAQIHSALDDRLETEQQLAAVYAKWGAQVELQHRIVMHLMLVSLAGVAAVVLTGVLLWWLAQLLVERESGALVDRRRQHTLKAVSSLAIELLTLMAVLLVIFGPPQQISTILGLMTAGLTVVFQDFILAFFGWFILMGRNGIRVGDWVEIDGVGGEVVEIGLFRTSMLETGNWTDKGHPTGRRVTFINNFAVSGRYFNFSTAGQWMWDEISVNVPAGEETYKTIESIHKAVLEATAQDVKIAETEWQSETRQRGLSQFSATPSVDLRPAPKGVDILVRYITRAQDRFEVRNRLYQDFLKLLGQSGASPGEIQA